MNVSPLSLNLKIKSSFYQLNPLNKLQMEGTSKRRQSTYKDVEETAKRRQSIYETIEKIQEKSSRRRSVFESSDQAIEERNTMESYNKRWNERWGKYNVDYVNVVKYPEEYVRNVKTEIKLWTSNLQEMIKKAEAFGDQTEDSVVLEDVELSPKQKATLQDIDEKMNQFMTKSKQYLESLEASRKMQELKLEQMNHNVNFLQQLVLLHYRKV